MIAPPSAHWHAQTAGALSAFLDGPMTTPILLLLNAQSESLTFHLPAPPASDLAAHWQLEIDTADPHGKGRSSALDGKAVLSSRAMQVWTMQRVETVE